MTGRRKTIVFFAFLTLVFLLILSLQSCAPSPVNYDSASIPTSESSLPSPFSKGGNPDIEKVAHSYFTDVYRFTDGDRICYFTEGSYNSSAGGGIWCTP